MDDVIENTNEVEINYCCSISSSSPSTAAESLSLSLSLSTQAAKDRPLLIVSLARESIIGKSIQTFRRYLCIQRQRGREWERSAIRQKSKRTLHRINMCTRTAGLTFRALSFTSSKVSFVFNSPSNSTNRMAL